MKHPRIILPFLALLAVVLLARADIDWAAYLMSPQAYQRLQLQALYVNAAKIGNTNGSGGSGGGVTLVSPNGECILLTGTPIDAFIAWNTNSVAGASIKAQAADSSAISMNKWPSTVNNGQFDFSWFNGGNAGNFFIGDPTVQSLTWNNWASIFPGTIVAQSNVILSSGASTLLQLLETNTQSPAVLNIRNANSNGASSGWSIAVYNTNNGMSYPSQLSIIGPDGQTVMILATNGGGGQLDCFGSSTFYGNMEIKTNLYVDGNFYIIGGGQGHGNAGSMTNLNPTNLVGIVPQTNIVLNPNAGSGWMIVNDAAGHLVATNSFYGTVTGNGSGLTNYPILVTNYYGSSGTEGGTVFTNTSGIMWISNWIRTDFVGSSAGNGTNNNFYSPTNFGPSMFYGDTFKTNGRYISNAGEVFSNAVGSVTLVGGNVTATGTITGNGSGLTNLISTNIVTQTKGISSSYQVTLSDSVLFVTTGSFTITNVASPPTGKLLTVINKGTGTVVITNSGPTVYFTIPGLGTNNSVTLGSQASPSNTWTGVYDGSNW